MFGAIYFVRNMLGFECLSSFRTKSYVFESRLIS